MIEFTGKVTQENVHLLLPWKIAGMAELMAKDCGITTLEAMRRIYAMPLYQKLADEATKLWHNSSEQLYLMLSAA